MDRLNWSTPRTEEGLLQTLLRLEERRKAGDQIEVGYGLLALSHLVKWVRSDTDSDPFTRSQELALEAVEVFRGIDESRGLAKALIAAAALAKPDERIGLLDEAENIATLLEDEILMAAVLAARGRLMALVDRDAAPSHSLRALEIFRKHGDRRGMAGCLFSLSITHGTDPEKRAFAEEAAEHFRALGDPEEAARCMMIAFMNAEEVEPIGELQALAKVGLKDALDAGSRSSERHFYEKLAAIAKANEQVEEAERYERWAADLEESDGLTEFERWESNVEACEQMIELAQGSGNDEIIVQFEQQLAELKAQRPEESSDR